MAQPASQEAPRTTAEAAPPLPGLRDPWLAAVLVAAAACLALAWWRQEGYQIADSVEYLERAQGIVLGHKLIDSQAIRGFGFSGLLVPLFAIASWLGVDELVHVVHAAQLLQVALSLALVVATARLAARVGGRECGLAAAALVAFNPTLLRWGVEPVSGVAASLFITLGLARALEPSRAKNGLIAGAWFGLAFMMAYQTILVIGTIALVVLVRDLRKRRGFIGRLALGLAACVLVQCVLDRLYYGTFGISVGRYFLENFGTHAALIVDKFGVLPGVGGFFHRASRWIYNQSYGLSEVTQTYQESVRVGEKHIPGRTPNAWYFVNIARSLAWPAVFLVLLGALRSLWRLSWSTFLLLAVIAANVGIMSLKGDKSFRLWIPFLPMIATFGGLGFAWILGALQSGARGPATLQPARAALGLVILASVAGLGVAENLRTNTRKYGGYWRSMAMICRAAEEGRAQREQAFEAALADLRARGTPESEWPQRPERVRLSAAYHWSMFLRESPQVELIKLPHHLDAWKSYSEAYRQEDFDVIARLDYFIAHLPVLTEHPDLFEVINRDFAVTGVFYDRVVYEGLGPIYVLRRKRGIPGELSFFDLVPEDAPQRASLEAMSPLQRFVHTAPDGTREDLALLDFRYEPLDGDGHGWITYTWRGGPLAAPDYWLLDRLTSPDGHNAWQNNHLPAYGMHPTSSWGAGCILRESYLVVAEGDPFRPDTVHRHLGGAYLRGDLIPISLWIDVARLDAVRHEPQERMEPLDMVTGERLRELVQPGGYPTARGGRLSSDGMVQVGALFLPVSAAARRPDDGRAVPLEE